MVEELRWRRPRRRWRQWLLDLFRFRFPVWQADLLPGFFNPKILAISLFLSVIFGLIWCYLCRSRWRSGRRRWICWLWSLIKLLLYCFSRLVLISLNFWLCIDVICWYIWLLVDDAFGMWCPWYCTHWFHCVFFLSLTWDICHLRCMGLV